MFYVVFLSGSADAENEDELSLLPSEIVSALCSTGRNGRNSFHSMKDDRSPSSELELLQQACQNFSSSEFPDLSMYYLSDLAAAAAAEKEEAATNDSWNLISAALSLLGSSETLQREQSNILLQSSSSTLTTDSFSNDYNLQRTVSLFDPQTRGSFVTAEGTKPLYSLTAPEVMQTVARQSTAELMKSNLTDENHSLLSYILSSDNQPLAASLSSSSSSPGSSSFSEMSKTAKRSLIEDEAFCNVATVSPSSTVGELKNIHGHNDEVINSVGRSDRTNSSESWESFNGNDLKLLSEIPYYSRDDSTDFSFSSSGNFSNFGCDDFGTVTELTPTKAEFSNTQQCEESSAVLIPPFNLDTESYDKAQDKCTQGTADMESLH